MNCDFTNYTALRNETASKSNDAQAACTALETAEAALVDAQAAVDEAQANKETAYAAWEQAEQAENAAAAELGINPVPPPGALATRRL